LIVNCDDYGRFDARPAIIKGSLFPLKTVTNKQIENALNKLSTVGIVYLYEVDGKPYLQFVTWGKHQRIRNVKEKYPAPNDKLPQVAASCGELPQVAASCGELRPESNPIQSESNPNTNPNPKDSVVVPDEILSEWNAYVDMRKKIKKPMTDKAALLALKKLNELAPDDYEKQKAILNQSVFNSWQGLFPLKGGYDEKTNRNDSGTVSGTSKSNFDNVV
ncbi:MAG: hypothetical protein WBI55_07780, partial [Eubacteriales bacterium]